ncbi:MAG: arylamine N-acetyltransferase [Proteobacteria bacterium]|nr:arylamine N-acetyltransferase [Pseudomonadota bacterium]
MSQPASHPAASDDVLDLAAYLHRIGYAGETAATLATLAALIDRHVRSIPFENLDVLLGRGVRLDLAAVQAKLVGARRGGYCFEHCTLMEAVLRRLGYDVVAHTARVTMVSGRAAAPRTHMILVVTLPEGRYVADPGLGGLAPRMPLPLVDQGDDPPGRPAAWLRREPPYWVMRARRGDAPTECWITTLDADRPIDFEVGNHYTATHPASAFRHHLMMRAHVDGGRLTIMNDEMTRWDGETPGTPRTIADRAELRALVAEMLGVDLPEVATLRVPAVPRWA